MEARALRAYAVGARFSVDDVRDQFAWRPTDIYWTDVTYRRPRTGRTDSNGNRRQRPRRTAPVSRRIDPSRIRTPDQQKAAGRRVCG